MKRFTSLIEKLDQTNATNKKIELLADYFLEEENEKNKLWTIAIFIGKRPPRAVNTSLIRRWCAELAGIPLWLFEQNYHIIGDLAETISLLLPENDIESDISLCDRIMQMQAIKKRDEASKKAYIFETWKKMDKAQLWVFNKLITGGFRIGVSKNIIIQALSKSTGSEPNYIAYLLTGNWQPDLMSWSIFTDVHSAKSDISKPYPFYLAYALPEKELMNINPAEWFAEWKWDGIRCQMIKREGQFFLWSRGEELITDKFPELEEVKNHFNDFVIDGELIAWSGNKPMDFNFLQTRIGRKNLSKKFLAEVPVRFIAYDLLEFNGNDIRQVAFQERRIMLQSVISPNDIDVMTISPLLSFNDIETLVEKRKVASEFYAEGLMLKRKSGMYHTGRKTGDMWKWKKDPFTLDAVMIYAQRGHGRRANLFSDFTFALRDGEKLLPFAKAYAGLTDVEMKEISEYVRKNTIETFGPVSSIKAELVFELAFEGISISKRHKSGFSVRFPRINRWRKDKSVNDIDTISDIKRLLDKE